MVPERPGQHRTGWELQLGWREGEIWALKCAATVYINKLNRERT
jgi:hypothetical protein